MAEQSTRMPIHLSRPRRHPEHAEPQPIEKLRSGVDRLLSDFLRGYWHVPFRRSAVDVEPILRGDISLGAMPAVDIVDRDDAYKFTAELPGVDKERIELKFSDGTLTIEGEKSEESEDAKEEHFVSERHYGDFHRTFRVPDEVDVEKIEAHLKDGLLTITLPKTAESRRKRKTIVVKAR